jgi:hypothetical protein
MMHGSSPQRRVCQSIRLSVSLSETRRFK